MFLYGESAVPSQQEYEFMGIPKDQQGVIPIEELSDYTYKVAEKRRELLRSGDVNVFAANALMQTITGLQQPMTAKGQVLPLMNAWQQMGEEPPIYPA